MRLARATGVVSGFLFVLLGAWGALIPFVGPYFDYSFGSNTAWQYTADRFWLNILPGAVAVLAGLLLLQGDDTPRSRVWRLDWPAGRSVVRRRAGREPHVGECPWSDWAASG